MNVNVVRLEGKNLYIRIWNIARYSFLSFPFLSLSHFLSFSRSVLFTPSKRTCFTGLLGFFSSSPNLSVVRYCLVCRRDNVFLPFNLKMSNGVITYVLVECFQCSSNHKNIFLFFFLFYSKRLVVNFSYDRRKN